MRGYGFKVVVNSRANSTAIYVLLWNCGATACYVAAATAAALGVAKVLL